MYNSSVFLVLFRKSYSTLVSPPVFSLLAECMNAYSAFPCVRMRSRGEVEGHAWERRLHTSFTFWFKMSWKLFQNGNFLDAFPNLLCYHYIPDDEFYVE